MVGVDGGGIRNDSGDALPVFSVGSHCEKTWYGQGCTYLYTVMLLLTDSNCTVGYNLETSGFHAMPDTMSYKPKVYPSQSDWVRLHVALDSFD